MTAADAARVLTRLTGEGHSLVRQLNGGETGAHVVRHTATGRQLVMKWEPEPNAQARRREAVVLAERLRTDAGWPVPRQQVVMGEGLVFILQEFMPGQPVGRLEHRMVDDLLSLHDRRLGLADDDDPSHWPAHLIETLVTGGPGYCLHESLLSYDVRTTRLLERARELGASLRTEDLTGCDVVHWDLHQGNLLAHDGRLAAVVDADFAVVGDAAFDLVTLALSSLAVPCERGVRHRLFSAALDPLDAIRTRAYLSHLLIRILDWPIRRHSAHEVEFWLTQAQELEHRGLL